MRNLLLPSFLLLGLAASGCAAKAKVTAPDAPVGVASPPSRPTSEATPAAVEAETGDDGRALAVGPIYYLLDSSQLSEESQARLTEVAGLLRQRPEARVTVSGHTCELGTSEYNLALGFRRATMARKYLEALGVEPARIAVVSYGEEQLAAQGSSESVHQRNRRSEFAFVLTRAAGASR